jgi:hypothetical protein
MTDRERVSLPTKTTAPRPAGLIHDPFGDQLITDTLMAHATGINLNDYLAARYAGATHQEVIDYHQSGSLPLALFAQAVQAGATPTQLQSLPIDSYTFTFYIDGLTAGVTHDQFVSYHDPDDPSWDEAHDRLSARLAGITHDAITQFDQAGGRQIIYYRRVLNQGATHQDIQDVLYSGGSALGLSAELSAGNQKDDYLATLKTANNHTSPSRRPTPISLTPGTQAALAALAPNPKAVLAASKL